MGALAITTLAGALLHEKTGQWSLLDQLTPFLTGNAILAGWIHWRLVRRLVDQHPRGARGLGLPPHVNPKTPDEGNPKSQKWYNPKCIHKNLF
jgi:hypothetical protein